MAHWETQKYEGSSLGTSDRLRDADRHRDKQRISHSADEITRLWRARCRLAASNMEGATKLLSTLAGAAYLAVAAAGFAVAAGLVYLLAQWIYKQHVR